MYNVSIVAEDAMRMKSDNQLAGATTFLNKSAKNLLDIVSLSWSEVVRVSCLNPARLLGLEHKKGDIKPGMDADILIVNDHWEPYLVIIEGNIVKNILDKVKLDSKKI